MALNTQSHAANASRADTPSLLLTVAEASDWATRATGRRVGAGNIMYLVNYGRVRNVGNNGRVMVDLGELDAYYRSKDVTNGATQRDGDDGLNWRLSFDEYRESERTKHVHRLHPYKGKFIPQLVEYFLDGHTDTFKKESWFNPGDTVLDPFCGSGTTLVQANELGLNAIGVDISEFNTWISNAKVSQYDVNAVAECGAAIADSLAREADSSPYTSFDSDYSEWLSEFNATHFPGTEFKRKVREGRVNERAYAAERLHEVVFRYFDLANEYGVEVGLNNQGGFLDRWYLSPVRSELERAKSAIAQLGDAATRRILSVVLSRTARTCRATTHADLATLVRPVWSPYYCKKHGKMCKPLLSSVRWWNRYYKDTVKRLTEFAYLRTETEQVCLTSDARSIDWTAALGDATPKLANQVADRNVKGIFTSPPYVGLIDYHEQHAYAYELLGFKRRDESEIGPMSSGQSRAARDTYVAGVSRVLSNSKRVLSPDSNIFVVANDKFGLYEEIASRAGLQIVDEYHRPVLHRTEKDRSPYSETIFHMRLDGS